MVESFVSLLSRNHSIAQDQHYVTVTKFSYREGSSKKGLSAVDVGVGTRRDFGFACGSLFFFGAGLAELPHSLLLPVSPQV
jgi:hypothetical protein